MPDLRASRVRCADHKPWYLFRERNRAGKQDAHLTLLSLNTKSLFSGPLLESQTVTDETLQGRAYPVPNNPVALITGSGAKRVGNSIASELAGRGYRIALHANHSLEAAKQTAEQLRERGCQCEVFQADLQQEAAARKLVDQAAEHFGQLDALVNSAAIWSPKRLEEVTADDVRNYLNVNTVGSFVCAQQAGKIMVDQPTGGCIINLGDWAIARPYVHYAAYFPSKGAIPAMTRCLAVELAFRNSRVRVNAVLPGPVMLPPDLPEPERQKVLQSTLAAREGSPRNIAHAVAFLLENDYVTGVCLPVDGGRSIFSPESFSSNQ